MYLKVNLQVVLKDKPPGYLGLCQTRYQVDVPGELGGALYGVIMAICESALDMGLLHDQSGLDEQLANLQSRLGGLRIVP